MRLKVKSGVTEELGKRLEKDGYEKQAEAFINSYTYSGNDSTILKVKGDVGPVFVEYMRDLGKELGYRSIQTQCTQILAVLNSPAKEKIKSLRSFEAGLLPFFEKDAIRLGLSQRP